MADASLLNLLKEEKIAATADHGVVANTKADVTERTLVVEAADHLMDRADAKRVVTSPGDAATAAVTASADPARTNTAGNTY
jgi:hypothetical protein